MEKLPLSLKSELEHALTTLEETAQRKGLSPAFDFELAQLREVADEALTKESPSLAEEALGFADSVRCQIRYAGERSELLLH